MKKRNDADNDEDKPVIIIPNKIQGTQNMKKQTRITGSLAK